MIGPKQKPMPKGMGEFFDFFRLLDNDDAFREKAAEMAAQMARLEELVGAHDTLELAGKVKADAEKLKQDAEYLKGETEREMDALRTRVGQELHEAAERAVQDEKAAAEMRAEAGKLLAEVTERGDTQSAEFARREKDLAQRESRLKALEEANRKLSEDLETKRAKMQEIWG